MLIRFVFAILVGAVFGLSARAADLAAIKRVILKEPSYEANAKPRYCLLVFGKEADTRIWMVYDGKRLYVDRNGSGDLTAPTARINGFQVDKIVERDGKEHKNLLVTPRSDGTFEMQLGQGERQQYVGIEQMERPTWGDKAENAPIIHFNGPMTFERYGPIYTIPRPGTNGGSRRFKLRVMLGTPGVGKGTFASYDEICSENLGPVQADIVYSHATKLGEVIEQRIELLHDGWDHYFFAGPVRIPQEAGAGVATVTLSYASEKGKNVTPSTIQFKVPPR